jgi:hypothetical protein
MVIVCVTCGKQCEQGDYRLIGVEDGSWASQYVHHGNCEALARERYAPKRPPVKAPRTRRKASEPPIVEELTIEETEPTPEEDALPWVGMERR